MGFFVLIFSFKNGVFAHRLTFVVMVIFFTTETAFLLTEGFQFYKFIIIKYKWVKALAIKSVNYFLIPHLTSVLHFSHFRLNYFQYFCYLVINIQIRLSYISYSFIMHYSGLRNVTFEWIYQRRSQRCWSHK